MRFMWSPEPHRSAVGTETHRCFSKWTQLPNAVDVFWVYVNKAMRILGVGGVYIKITAGVEWLRMVTTDWIQSIWRSHEWGMNVGHTHYVALNVWDINSGPLSRAGRKHECVIKNKFPATDILLYVHYRIIYKLCSTNWMGHPKSFKKLKQ